MASGMVYSGSWSSLGYGLGSGMGQVVGWDGFRARLASAPVCVLDKFGLCMVWSGLGWHFVWLLFWSGLAFKLVWFEGWYAFWAGLASDLGFSLV